MKKPNQKEERKLYALGYQLIAGLDEAGRGAWAGPLVAAAVILPKNHKIKGINDSKKLKPKQREKLYVQITKLALAWTVHLIEHKEIDKIGMKQANHLVFQKLIEKINPRPDYILVDALNVSFGATPSKSFIKGDEKITSIAAASIIAKVTRDQLMNGLHRLYPQYEFRLHKGYGTALHRQLIKKYRPSSVHRRSFSPVKNLLKLRKL